jgi:putative transposase
LGNVITIDDERIKSHLDRVVRGSVEETLNALLDAEADRLCNAQRYERSEARRDTRAGHYERKLQIKAGKVSLRIPFGQAPTPGGGTIFSFAANFYPIEGEAPRRALR